MTLPKHIHQRRIDLGLSLRFVAKEVGVDPGYLSRIERGQSPPSQHVLVKLASALDWDADQLLMLAGLLPDSIRSFVEKAPNRATVAIRHLAAMTAAEPHTAYGAPGLAIPSPRLIEDGFPFEELSEIAEIESWRKEVYRPVYHVHKWWAQRLGSVFRAAILGAASPRGSALIDLFYQPVKLPAPVVFDPFMGSGTTAGEAHKLGCTVIARDINPVAYRSVRTALGPLSRTKLLQLYSEVEERVSTEIRALYLTKDERGRPAEVLYFFWVKVLPCPECNQRVDLFSTFVFAKHAYARENPEVHVVCPDCGDVFASTHQRKDTRCPSCKARFRQHEGHVSGSLARCRSCRHSFPMAQTARKAGRPPEHRLFAKLVLLGDGTKKYLRTTPKDVEAYEMAKKRLLAFNPPLPHVEIQSGHNTRQVLNYGYRFWDEMFNERQLLALALLADGLRALSAGPERDALYLLFSGILEFNNMFASYKGEGTGAVRHMFSHHVLKPERMPIEANVWGTPKSSGAFSTLFRSRILRAVDYREAPFEVRVDFDGNRKRGEKVFGLSPPRGQTVLDHYPSNGLPAGSIYLSCGDSASMDVPDSSVDYVITDPPFFDNVHYSELADFFFVWQELLFRGATDLRTTRRVAEVQDTDAAAFGDKLAAVFAECHRVLRDDGLMVFSYHHSRDDGWSAVARAVLGAGFTFVQAQPVKAEMSGAQPKNQAKEPIDLDVLMVCRKTRQDDRPLTLPTAAFARAKANAQQRVERFNRLGRALSRNDILVVILSQLLVELSPRRSPSAVIEEFQRLLERARTYCEVLDRKQVLRHPIPGSTTTKRLSLFDPEDS